MAYAQIWKCALIGLGPKGEAIVNTFHYGAPDGADPDTSAFDVVTSFQGIMEAVWPLMVTTDWHEYECTALCIKGAFIGRSATIGASAPTPGTLAAPSAPFTVAAIGRRLSNGTGRHSRGRCYICPIPAASVDVDGRFTPPAGWNIAWNGAATATPMAGGLQYESILYNAASGEGTFINLVTEADLIGVQRRRRLRLPN